MLGRGSHEFTSPGPTAPGLLGEGAHRGACRAPPAAQFFNKNLKREKGRTKAPVARLQQRRVQLPVRGEGHHQLRLAWQTAVVCERACKQPMHADCSCVVMCQEILLDMAGRWSLAQQWWQTCEHFSGATDMTFEQLTCKAIQ